MLHGSSGVKGVPSMTAPPQPPSPLHSLVCVTCALMAPALMAPLYLEKFLLSLGGQEFRKSKQNQWRYTLPYHIYIWAVQNVYNHLVLTIDFCFLVSLFSSMCSSAWNTVLIRPMVMDSFQVNIIWSIFQIFCMDNTYWADFHSPG